MSVTNDFLLLHRDEENDFWIAPRMLMADGFTISTQAHSGAYSQPRNGRGPWTHIELGFPSERPNDEIMGYVEDAETPTQTVYGYVPVEAVDRLISEHGGLADPSER